MLVISLGSGCTAAGSGTSTPATSGAPLTLRDCGKEATDPGSPDGGVVAGLDWPSGEWALRTPAQAYVCIGGYAGSTLTVVQAGSPLTVRPARFTVPEGGGVLPVTVTATASGTTTLRLRVVSPAGKRELLRTVAVVVADGERWHLKRAS